MADSHATSQPTNRRRFRWPVVICFMLAIQSAIAVREVIGGTFGSIIAIGYAALMGGLSVHLDQRAQRAQLRESATGGILQQTLHGHTAWVPDAELSPDQQLIASASWDKTVRLWRTIDGTLVHTLTQHTESVWGVAFSPDGTVLASAGLDDVVRLWRVADGTLLRTLSYPGGVQVVVFSPDGQFLASAGAARDVRLWQVADGTLVRTIPHTTIVDTITYSPDGRLLAIGDWDSQIQLMGTADWKVTQTLIGHTAHVRSLTFSPDGALLASAAEGNDHDIRLWRVIDGANVNTYPLRFSADDLAFTPDGRTLAATSFDQVYFWKVP